jgi:hypothetical protein
MRIEFINWSVALVTKNWKVQTWRNAGTLRFRIYRLQGPYLGWHIYAGLAELLIVKKSL